MLNLINCDCLELMKRTPDNHFNLAICDPPYGIGVDGQKLSNNNKNPKHNRKEHEFMGWDNAIPNEDYFKELFRISKNQIIWGGNYFTEFLPVSRGWIFWYKGQNDLTMSDGEMAWSSFDVPTRQKEINRFELKKEGTIHPTQKPIRLYKWLLDKYANKGDTIFDSHLGSMSIAIACHDYGFDLTGCELNESYFLKGIERVENHKKQIQLF